jgi:stage V sporulation protein B
VTRLTSSFGPRWKPWFVGQGTRHRVARTAFTSLLSLGAATVTGIVIARGLGPAGRGHFASIMAWFGIALVLSDVGQSTSLTYHVARWPDRAGDFIASSRALMLLTGTVVAVAGVAVSPQLAGGEEAVAWAYRIAFVGSLVNCGFAAYVFATQATSLTTWNVLRASQPIVYLALVLVLWATRQISLLGTVIALVLSMILQGVLSATMCHRLGISAGRVGRAEVSELTRYGVAQSASAVPSAFGLQIDKIILARVVGAAPLGQYAVASSVVALGAPLGSAIGGAVFPRLSRSDVSIDSRRALERKSILTTAVLLTGATLGIAVAGHWLIPLLYGPGFEEAAGLLWWLVPMVIARSVSGVIGDLLRARGRPSLVALAQWWGVIITVAALLVLVGPFGLPGAGAAVGLGQSGCLLVSLLAMRRAGRS